ncbi:hypothetical protein ACKFRT_04535 [Corynebacterium sp. YSMAA1_1_F7]|uniref:hypothetical protein n=1 Tax=Corynebacterium sp. YSMAA1_1_F7 TaxID=3383590 RepID=UPI0038D07092
MPKIIFRLLANQEQLAAIEQDFRSMISALGAAFEGTLNLQSGLPADPELVTTWVELFGASPDEGSDPAVGAELTVDVARYDMGSVSGLAMHFAELLTTREKEPAEPILRQVHDDPGSPRVPWHVTVVSV